MSLYGGHSGALGCPVRRQSGKVARAAWYVKIPRWIYAAAAHAGYFLRRRLELMVGSGLLKAGDTDTDFGFAIGFLPTDFVVILLLVVVRCGMSVRFFLTHLRRNIRQLLTRRSIGPATVVMVKLVDDGEIGQ